MALGILERRRARRQAELVEAVSKALSPSVALAAASADGYVQSGVPSRPVEQAGLSMLATLPRGNQFLSAFGPGVPLIPEPIDQVDPATGRVMPRRSEYPVSWNLQLVDRQIPWTVLRRVAEGCDVVNRAIQLKQDEVVGYNWGWGFSPQLLSQIKDETGETSTGAAWAIAREKYGAELLRVQQFFEMPDADMNQDWASWLQAALWDHFVYDGIAIYPRYTFGGKLRALELVDASTIKLLRDDRGRVPAPPAPAYQQILYGFPRGEYQHSPGDPDDDYSTDQLAYFIRRPRNTTVYGFPQVEEVLALAATYLDRQAWMRAEYTHGVTPKMLVNVDDQGQWTPEQWEIYEKGFNDRLSGQTQRRQMAFFMRAGAQAQWAPQIDEHYKSDYDNWLISQIGSRFGVAATQLGVQAKAGLSGGKQMEGEASQAEQFSTKALINFLVNLQNIVARRYLGVGPEITAMCTGGQDEDLLSEVQADVALVNGGIMLRTEARNKRGLPVLDIPEADQLAVTTAQGVTFLAGTFEAQQEAIAQGATAGVPSTDPAHNAPPPDNGPAKDDDETGTDKADQQQEAKASPDNEAAKELAAFERFADTRLSKGRTWRDFQFRALGVEQARALNDAGRSGLRSVLEGALSKAREG